jgi:endonuclease YncB( thermonuclease family)
MRIPALALAAAALAAAFPLPSGAGGARMGAPAAIVPVHPHAQPYVKPLGDVRHSQPQPHGPHAGAGHSRHPNAHLMPGLVVYPPHRPTHPIAGVPPHHRPPARHVHFIGPAVVVAAPIWYAGAPYGVQELAAPAYAIDGDTFDSGGVRYRLYGIDAPELDEPLGPHARARLQQLLAIGPVTVIPLALDVYGRTVADVMVAGLNAAGVLRAEGFAKP